MYKTRGRLRINHLIFFVFHKQLSLNKKEKEIPYQHVEEGRISVGRWRVR